jgi:4-hydroxy-tetrahydrodipicolinate synthase
MIAMEKQKLDGLGGYLSALPTPFRNQAIDESAFGKFCEWQIRQGVWGLVVNGTTAEAPTLTPAEQERLLRIAVEAAQHHVPVIAGIGSNATSHTIELAQQAERAGADALLAVTPYYNKPSQEGLFRHFCAVHDLTGLPIILYDVPSRTGCELRLDTVCRLAELPRIIGIKDATGDLTRPAAMRRLLGERFRLLSGDDATALDYMGLGGDGCVSVASNVAPKLCNRLFLACFCGEPGEARAIERQLKPLVAALFLESNPVPLKWAMSLMGHMSAELRLPLCEPAETTRGAMRKALTQLGLIGPNLLLRNAARALSLAG